MVDIFPVESTVPEELTVPELKALKKEMDHDAKILTEKEFVPKYGIMASSYLRCPSYFKVTYQSDDMSQGVLYVFPWFMLNPRQFWNMICIWFR